jgi:hypothetical protein
VTAVITATAIIVTDAATSCVSRHAPAFVHADVSPARLLKTVTVAANYQAAALPGPWQPRVADY